MPTRCDVELEPLRFDGTIERADYQRMLPRGEQEWWLCLVLAVLLGICIFVFGPVSVLFAISEGKLLVGLGLMAFWTLMLAGLWFLKSRISARDRAARYLKLYPDVLGTAQGKFTAGGLSFHDGVHTYWFGPQHLLRTVVSADGMRVHVDASAHRYLALSARMFDCFNVDSANQLKRHWRTLAEMPVLTENPHGLELWNQIGQPPAEAIPFRGSATTHIPWRTPAFRNKALMESGSVLFIATFLFIARDRMESWMSWGGALLLGYTLITSTLNWWNYFKRTQQQSWYQSGWISPQQFAICTGNAGVRMPIGEIVQKMDYPDQILLTLQRGQSYCILRQMVDTDEQWQRLCAFQLGNESSSPT
ncbi:MAG: hypothetical protein ABI557_10520 [Aureliella sp.]